MNFKQILHISDHYATLYTVRGKTVNRIGCFHTPDALDEFVDSLGMRTSPLEIVIGFGNEAFDSKTFPHVGTSDRKSLLERYLNKTFPDSEYRHAIFQGRSTEGRKDDEFLIFGIGVSDNIDSWIKVLTKHKVSISGIHSLPILAEQLAKEIDTHSELLLVGYSSHNHAQRIGIHLLFFLGGKLKISRLHYHFKGDDQAFFKGNALEVKRTIEYLYANKAIPQGKTVKVVTISPSDWLENLSTHLVDNKDASYQYFSNKKIAENIGIKCPTEEVDFPTLIMPISARKNETGHYRTDSGLVYFRHARVNKILNAASIVLGICVFIASAYTIYETTNYRDQIAEFESLLPGYQRELGELDQKIAPYPVTATEMKELVITHDTLMRNAVTPEDLISDISPILSNFSDMELTQISWETTNIIDSENIHDQYSDSGENASELDTENSANTMHNETNSNLFRRHVTINAQIDHHNKSMKNIVERIDKIRNYSQQQAQISTAKLVKTPVTLSSNANTTGTMQKVKVSDNPDFTMELIIER